MRDLTVTLVQCQLAWENPADNRQQFEDMLADGTAATDLVLLPEMFTTGFSMNAVANAEEPGGATEQWMQALARRYDCALCGSIAVHADGGVYNRLLFATPDSVEYYDKRHLFRMAGEHRRYLPGTRRSIVHWRGWRLKTEVCYDLRFPVFSRNRQDYDALLYVANWPASRAAHWRCLLQARAIENQACVVGVNRIGSDANGLNYSGDSLAIDARGTILADMEGQSGCVQARFSGEELLAYRESFPCHLDADAFEINY